MTRRYVPTQTELDAAWLKYITAHPNAPIPERYRRRLFAVAPADTGDQ